MKTVKSYLTILLLGAVLFSGKALSGVTYYHTDFMGSPAVITNEAGQVISRSHYEPFGDSVEGVQQDVGYTGHQHDAELGLTYMQARYYDPVIGRFYSNDPVGFLGNLQRGNPVHGFNRYAYANNNPYAYTDPDGETPRRNKDGDAGAAIAGAILVGLGVRTSDEELLAQGIVLPKKDGSANGRRAGKKHTRAAIKKAKQLNAAKNDGKVLCTSCGKETTEPTQRTKGSTVNPREAQGDHIQPRAKGGDGATVKDQSNIDIKCSECNLKKSDDLP